ncbi:MAG TPA: FxSxx-COOH system tetratricopeptide repeat protein [Streptosporangiaceae bacterium]|nr:FxSxx-COOH system tetratricopeptide repeat protein [Streptosporangiaceae bacterium]
MIVTRPAAAGLPSWPAPWPVRSGPVPPLAECFSTRPETGPSGAQAPRPGGTVVLTQPAPPEAGDHSLAALGGTGKTQLAVAIALSAWRAGDIDLLAWVQAGSREAILSGYAAALEAAEIPGARANPRAAAATFLAWLAETSRPWLLVIDDVADVADLDGLWPSGPAGLVLVTTRRQAAEVGGAGRTIIEVGPFSPREAVSYLTARLREPDMRAGAPDLASDLGYLPLSLAMASAVIADTKSDCRSYRERLAERARQVSAAVTGENPRTVAAAWSLSLDRADATAPPRTAGYALAVAALLDSAGVPEAVLTSRAACDYICGPGSTSTAADQAQVRSVFDSLARAGLVTIDPECPPRTVRVHGRVQAAIRQLITPKGLGQAAVAAASALLQAWPPADRDPVLAQALRDCTASLHRAAAEPLWSPDVHPVLLRAGQSLDRAGLHDVAVSYWQRLFETGRRILGDDHLSTVRARDGLAAAYLSAGRAAEAAVANEQSLADRERVLGADHPETLTSCGNFARACMAAGRAADAVPLYRRALAGREQALGPGDPATVAARGDLAAAYLEAGQPQQAIDMLRPMYGDREAVMGAGHPETLAACGELAAALHSGGRLAEAIPLYERVLAGREEALGATHPDTMAARANLAHAYRSADRMKQALPVYERTLADRERALGPDHPDTLASMASLASAYHAAGRLKHALPLYEQVLDRRERRDGPDNPGTLAARGDLASAYHSSGRLAQAIPMYERTLQDHERVMGEDHPGTVTARANLASAYHTVGWQTAAVALLQHTHQDKPAGRDLGGATGEQDAGER